MESWFYPWLLITYLFREPQQRIIQQTGKDTLYTFKFEDDSKACDFVRNEIDHFVETGKAFMFILDELGALHPSIRSEYHLS
jgi:hypothetical protein